MVHCSVEETLVFKIPCRYLSTRNVRPQPYWVDSDEVEHVIVLQTTCSLRQQRLGASPAPLLDAVVSAHIMINDQQTL